MYYVLPSTFHIVSAEGLIFFLQIKKFYRGRDGSVVACYMLADDFISSLNNNSEIVVCPPSYDTLINYFLQLSGLDNEFSYILLPY